MDDSELLRRYARDRSEEAFTELVKRHLDLVFSAASRQVGGDVHRAWDVAQVVFTDLARKAPELVGHTALVGWLYTSTHFTAAKLRRSEERRLAREREAHAMHEMLGSASEQPNWEQLRPVLDVAMHELKPRDREAVLLRFFEKRSFAEVGRHLGLGENAARMSVERALEKLGGLLARRGITSSGAALSFVLTNQTVAAAPSGMVAAIASGALGQAAVAGSLGFGATLAQFMANTKLTIAAAGVAGLLTLGLGVYFAHQAAQVTAEFKKTEDETEALRRRLRRIESPIAAAAVAPPPNSDVVPLAEMPESAATPNERVTRALLNDTEAIRLRAQRERMTASRRFGPLYADLGWDAAHMAQFETIYEEAVAEDLRAQGGAQLKGNSMTLGPEITKQIHRVRADFEDRLRVTFGDAVLQRFLDWERTAEARDVAAEIAGRVYFTDTPLMRAQTEALVRIIEAASPGHPPGQAVAHRTLDWEQVLTEARSVLAPAQLAALRAIRTSAELEAKRFAVLFPETKP